MQRTAHTERELYEKSAKENSSSSSSYAFPPSKYLACAFLAMPNRWMDFFFWSTFGAECGERLEEGDASSKVAGA